MPARAVAGKGFDVPDAAAHAALARLESDGAGPVALAAFRRRLEQLDAPGDGGLPGSALEPLGEVADATELPDGEAAVLDRVAVLKLNGGLGTSMGLRGPKSLLEARDGLRFLDVIVRQVQALRREHSARLPLVLMNSAATRGPSLEAVGELAQDVPADFLQGREPKLDAATHAPVDWPADPALEWCPPGHGDVYVSLAESGMLERLRGAGYRWAFVSNADNLGAVVDPRIAAWVAREELPFAMEVVRGTAADRKGGHLALHDGRVVLRETAQVPDGDDSFGDVARWRFYNTNNLWVDLDALAASLEQDPAGPALPLIVNRKRVDPTDPASPPVLQLESAMGAAIGAIDGARPILVGRERFVPVKTTDDLLVLRSDAYVLGDDGRLRPRFEGPGPVVTLDPEHFRALDAFEARFPAGAPSLARARRFEVRGDVRFGAGVVVDGDVVVEGPRAIADGEVLR